MSRFRLAAFDLDGTLVDSAPDLAGCLSSALAALGFERPGLQQVRSWIGNGVEVLIERGLTAALGSTPDHTQLRLASQHFHSCYSRNLFSASQLYPDVPQTLQRLLDSGLRIGCITNKREAYARELLTQSGLAPLMSFIYGGDTFPVRKPDPAPLLHACTLLELAPEQVVLVGDSVNDCLAAAAAGTAFIFAAYGYGPAADAALHQGFGTLTAFSDLEALLCAD